MDKLSKKDCFKRFKRVFSSNLGIQSRLQRYKAKRHKKTILQSFKDARFTFNLFRCFTGLNRFFAVLFVSHRASGLVGYSTREVS